MNLPEGDSKLVAQVPEILVGKADGLISTGEGLALLERYLQEAFPQDAIKKMILDLCTAEDVRMGKTGEYRTPNWQARRDGLDRVLKLLKYTAAVEHAGSQRLPTKVTFNVVNITPESAKQEQVLSKTFAKQREEEARREKSEEIQLPDVQHNS